MTKSNSLALMPQSDQLGPPAKPTDAKAVSLKRLGLIAAAALFVVIALLPAASGLPRAGQVLLAILAFAVIAKTTKALDYAVSAVVIGTMMVFMLAYSLDAAKPLGTGAALGLALSGFPNSAVALVAAAFFIAAAMTATGLDRRIALMMLSKVDAKTNHIVMRALGVGIYCRLLCPVQPRRSGAWCPS